MAEKDDKKKPGEAAAAGAPVKSKKKIFILIGIGVVAVAIIGVGVFAFLNKKGKPSADNTAVTETAKVEEKGKEGKEGGHGGKEGAAPSRFFTLEPFILNLADVESNRYLKISVSIEFADPRTTKEAEGKVPVVRDALVLLMSSLTYGEIHSVEGKITLQSEIQNRLNKILETGTVKRVYFTDLVVQ